MNQPTRPKDDSMTERVIDRVMEMAGQLREQGAEAEKIGRLTDQTTKAMKAAGNIRLLQPAKYSGYEVHPREFAETVMATASLDPAAGWVNGVVGVHPYQLTYADPRVAEEIWGNDVDTWVASPYAPQGVAKPVDGGYIFNGRWQFSSGTDQCEWIILGALLGDADGKPLMPPQMLHMIQGAWQIQPRPRQRRGDLPGRFGGRPRGKAADAAADAAHDPAAQGLR